MQPDYKSVCLGCGDLMDAPSERQIEIFGEPECCEMPMVKIDRNKIHKIIDGLEKLRENLQREATSGTFNL